MRFVYLFWNLKFGDKYDILILVTAKSCDKEEELKCGACDLG